MKEIAQTKIFFSIPWKLATHAPSIDNLLKQVITSNKS